MGEGGAHPLQPPPPQLLMLWRGSRFREGKIRVNVWTVCQDKKVAVAIVYR